MALKKFKEPKYLIQIDARYRKIEMIVIHLYTFETIRNKKFITYWTEVYSFKSKKPELYEMCETFGEMDRVFNTIEYAEDYCEEIIAEFEPYRSKLRCLSAYTDMVQKRDNIQSGISDVKYFTKSSELWRFS